MAKLSCAGCDATFDAAAGFHSADGMICPTCHGAQEQSAIETEGDGIGLLHGLDASPLGREEVRREVRDDGTVVTHTRSVSVDLGPLNVVVRFVQRLLRRRE